MYISPAETEHKLIRCDPLDPKRCQATGQEGQCPFLAEGDTKNCLRHQGGNKTTNASVRKYMVAKWQESINFQADHPEIKNMNEDIGILRMLVKARLESCTDDTMLNMNAGPLINLIEKISVVNDKWHKIQMQTNTVMDKNQALDFINKLSNIVGESLADLPDATDRLKKIADQMYSELQQRTSYSLKGT